MILTSAEPSGKVVKVDPGEGTSVDVGTAITLYVSNGSQEAVDPTVTIRAAIIPVTTQITATIQEIKRTVLCREEL